METVRFRDSYGQMRNGVKKECEFCKNLFCTRVARAKTQRCCSRTCTQKLQATESTTKVKCVCSWCGLEHLKTKCRVVTSKNGLFFCCRKCKDQAQRLGGIKEIMPPHYGTSKSRIKKSELYPRLGIVIENCFDCGDTREYLLSIHHIDSNGANNTKENIEIVCYNCHAKRHLEFKNNKWQVNFKVLTPRDKLKEL